AVQLDDEKRIGAALMEADIAFVSVGGANLKSLGEKIGRIYEENGIPKKLFNFVTCENWRNAGAFLYEGITTQLSEEKKTVFD
ncbi:mannitol-1-phosphate 5-dehydrogenase, partial [Erysipelatoclostridium ramosum]|nr:mannitol-1-phosphate 5-dehydrogenase [Thomasclavelia ramosa]